MKTRMKNLADLTRMAKGGQREVLALPIDNVESKSQVRTRFVDLEELAESLKVEGQQMPIIVSPKNSDGKYVIQKGERRWRAAEIGGLKTIDVIVNTKEQNHLDALAGEMIENIQRDDLTALEIASAIKVFLDAGWKQVDIAKRLSKTRPYVSMYASLADVPSHIRKLHDNDVVLDAVSLSLLRQMHELDQAYTKNFCKKILKTGASRSEIRKELNRLKTPLVPQEALSEQLANDAPKVSITESSQDLEQQPHDEETIKTPIIEPVLSSQPDENNMVNNDKWIVVEPHRVVVQVLVDDGNNDRLARLLINRLSIDKNLVWIQEDDKHPELVNLETVKIIEMGTAHEQQ